MSLRHVKEQIAALKAQIGHPGGREWITIAVPVSADDETVNAWLDDAVGADWRRHVVVRLILPSIVNPEVVERVPVGETAGLSGLAFAADEAGLL